MNTNAPKHMGSTIALNRRASHEYLLETRFEAGLVLQGWEVKSLRAGRTQLTESYVLVKNGELWVLGLHITPLNTTSTHVTAEPNRTRKLLLHEREINQLIGQVERKGYALVPTALYWSRGRAKIEIALGKGKKTHDKRAAIKDRDWNREKTRLLQRH